MTSFSALLDAYTTVAATLGGVEGEREAREALDLLWDEVIQALGKLEVAA